MPAILDPGQHARLIAAGITVASETEKHWLLVREPCAVLVDRASGTIGSTGVMTPNGLAYLVWRDGQALLAAKGSESPAPPEIVTETVRFAADVKQALETPYNRSSPLPQ